MIMHRKVEITVESYNKGGSMIGWLFVGNVNLSLALGKGLFTVHKSAEHSKYFKLLQQVEKVAKDKKINVYITILNKKYVLFFNTDYSHSIRFCIYLWKNYVEKLEEANNYSNKPIHEEMVKERKINYLRRCACYGSQSRVACLCTTCIKRDPN